MLAAERPDRWVEPVQERGLAAPAACRFCGSPLTTTLVDLGMSPLSNAFIAADRLQAMEPFYPLHALVCDRCFLVQLAEFESPDRIFRDYAYFSSYSESWLRHAAAFAAMATRRFGLGPHSFVVEVASNDGYLLRNFIDRGIPALGIEPAGNVAAVAEAHGVPTRVRFFGAELAAALAAEDRQADLLVANNVLAHVPALNDFVAGLRLALKPDGVLSLEFPHLLRLLEENQFDTIYHEHFSYFSFTTAERVLATHGLTVFDVEELSTHGGSLRVFARRREHEARTVAPAVGALRRREEEAGLSGMQTYRSFSDRVMASRRALLGFLIRAREEGRSVVAYGAAAKGNTLLNYCGIRTDLIEYVVDRSPHKQGSYTPGTRIPVLAPEAIARTRPDYVLILPWNLQDEIVEQMGFIREWGGLFVVPVPSVRVLP
jgi:SAM-dependent methyltransferase